MHDIQRERSNFTPFTLWIQLNILYFSVAIKKINYFLDIFRIIWFASSNFQNFKRSKLTSALESGKIRSIFLNVPTLEKMRPMVNSLRYLFLRFLAVKKTFVPFTCGRRVFFLLSWRYFDIILLFALYQRYKKRYPILTSEYKIFFPHTKIARVRIWKSFWEYIYGIDFKCTVHLS